MKDLNEIKKIFCLVLYHISHLNLQVLTPLPLIIGWNKSKLECSSKNVSYNKLEIEHKNPLAQNN